MERLNLKKTSLFDPLKHLTPQNGYVSKYRNVLLTLKANEKKKTKTNTTVIIKTDTFFAILRI